MQAQAMEERENVPANPLSRLLHRRSPLPAEAEAAIQRLGRLVQEQPDLEALAAINATLIQTMYTHELHVPYVSIHRDHAAVKQEAGLPLLRGEPISYDPVGLRDQFLRLCGVMHDHGNQFAGELRRVAKAGTFPVADLAVEVIAGEPGNVAARADALGLDAGLAATLLRLTLFPSMVRLAATFEPLLGTETWRRGYCPVCGAWPLLGEYRGLELTRFLRCGLCAAAWESDRLVCPICDNRVFQDLNNLTVEGEELKQRATTCERCHCYIKQISTLVPIPPAELLVADLETLHLDLIAHERAFMPPQ